MANNVTIVLNHAGVRSLLRSPEVRADLERRAAAIAASAGAGFETDSEIGPNRARASVRTATTDAREAEASGHALSRAIGAGR